jgi:hypothetical protein
VYFSKFIRTALLGLFRTPASGAIGTSFAETDGPALTGVKQWAETGGPRQASAIKMWVGTAAKGRGAVQKSSASGRYD